MSPIHYLIPKLVNLYRLMDKAYAATARQALFSCENCDGARCCTVDLVLHSLVEMCYLKQGFQRLPREMQTEILERSARVLSARDADPNGDPYRTAVCVLNFDGMCGLYQHRPMICRLAGIRHFFVRPDGREVTGPGCARFETGETECPTGIRLDRTRFYEELASIEMAAVGKTGKRTKPRTVAETIAGMFT